MAKYLNKSTDDNYYQYEFLNGLWHSQIGTVRKQVWGWFVEIFAGFMVKDSQMDKDFIIGIGKSVLLKGWHTKHWLRAGTPDFHQH